jgi:molybdopterin molybdotransferase
MLTYEEALQKVLETVQPLRPVTVPLALAPGRVLAAAVTAGSNLPPSDNSAMDGYAFAWTEDISAAPLTVIDFVAAGYARQFAVPAGNAVKIMTGAPIPPGCDTVVPIEDVEVEDGSIRLKTPPKPGENVRYCGEELRCGELVLDAGTPLFAGEIGLLAAAGIETVLVHPAPRVAILSTGDELVELGDPLTAGKIVNSNAYLLATRLREEGCDPILLGIARDTPEELAAALKKGLQADLLLTTGGVSVGDCDHVQEALVTLGFTRKFWKVAIKPGKPVLFGMINDQPVFGLPGNPAATAATFELFVQPALRRLAGFSTTRPPRLRVALSEAIKGGGNRQRFIWGRLEICDGFFSFSAAHRQGSGQNRSLQGAHALLPMAAYGPDLPAGSEVEILLLRMPVGQP